MDHKGVWGHIGAQGLSWGLWITMAFGTTMGKGTRDHKGAQGLKRA